MIYLLQSHNQPDNRVTRTIITVEEAKKRIKAGFKTEPAKDEYGKVQQGVTIVRPA